MYFILMDAHSKWLEVEIMSSTTSLETIKVLRRLFARYGLPETLVSDNGPQLVSQEFRHFTQSNGIRHVTSAPYHPATNGEAERAVQFLKQSLRKGDRENIECTLNQILLKYRTTPHSLTGLTPAELFVKRHLRTRLDLLKPDLSDFVRNKQQRWGSPEEKCCRQFQLGENVLVLNFSVNGGKWVQGTITRQTGPVSYTVKVG
jgi:hypothetical protein